MSVVTAPPPLVAPFAGERYRAARLSALVAPPYDVISPEARAEFAARDPHNIVHLILPEAVGGEDRYRHAATLLREWREAHVFTAEKGPAVYVVAQRFTLPTGEQRTRVGMFAAVSAEAGTGRVRPHERTHAAPKADRLALLEATGTNLESIFLLAPDADGALASALARAARGTPAARAALEGVDIRLWVITGKTADHLAALAGRAQLYIADGHHRFETAARYAARHPNGASRVLSFVVSVREPGLVVLPTHRLVEGPRVDPAPLLARWREWFDVGRVAPCADRVERLAALGRDQTACLVAFPDGFDVSLVLKRGSALDAVADLGRSEAVRSLDVARVDALVVRALEAGGALGYTPDARVAFDAVRAGRASAAVLLNPTRVSQVLAVADAGDVMPPKSTYFVPKVPSGLVLRPLAERGEQRLGEGREIGRGA
jgi:uncharacterized protein (DUF1015 family)